MPSTKPTIVWVPGAWHLPSHYKLTTDILASQGYKVVTIRLPANRHTAPWPTDFTMDAGAVASAILIELDEWNEVVVVMHSYGGIPGSAAIEGLTKDDREKKSLKGGVVGLVYISGIVLKQGYTLAMMHEASGKLPNNVRRVQPEYKSDVSDQDSLVDDISRLIISIKGGEHDSREPNSGLLRRRSAVYCGGSHQNIATMGRQTSWSPSSLRTLERYPFHVHYLRG